MQCNVCMYIFMYVCIYVCVYIYIYIFEILTIDNLINDHWSNKFIGGLRPPNPPTWRFAPKRAPRATQKGGGEGPIYCNLGDFHFFQLVKISMQPDILTYIGSLIQYFLIFFMGREKIIKNILSPPENCQTASRQGYSLVPGQIWQKVKFCQKCNFLHFVTIYGVLSA